jgi:ubiquinone/menaquinone biosynthesis C-methylase UbiE
MEKQKIPDDYYERIKPDLHRRIGRELRLAGKVLDIGCGSCDLVRHLAGVYRQEVTGVDITPRSFPTRRRSGNDVRFHCLRRDAAYLKYIDDRSVDAVVTMWALHELERPQLVLKEVRRVLRPGGEILIVDFPRDSLAQRLWDENYYRPEEVEKILEQAAFEEIRLRLIHRKQVIWARGYQPAVVES